MGDVIDRGTDGIKILKWLMSQHNIELILGNHEAMMLSCDFLFDEITESSIGSLTGTKLELFLNWQDNGAGTTLNALSSIRNKEIEYILEYLREAPLYETVSAGGRDFLLTHSGIDHFKKDKRMSEYSDADFLWNRPKMTDRYFDNITTVFGHTPTLYLDEKHTGKPIFTDTWIDIDTGAACGFPPMLLRLDDMKEFYLEE